MTKWEVHRTSSLSQEWTPEAVLSTLTAWKIEQKNAWKKKVVQHTKNQLDPTWAEGLHKF